MIVTDVKTLVILTVAGNARTHYLTQTVDIVSCDVKTCLDLVAHLFRPGLSAAYSRLELYLIKKSLVAKHLGEVKKIRGRAGDCRSTEIYHHRCKLFRVSGTHRNYHSTESFSTVMRAETACEKSVAVGYLDYIILCYVSH